MKGGTFHLHTADGKSKIAVVLLQKGTPKLLYYVCPEFIKKYHELLPLGVVYKWGDKEGLVAWLDSVIYHSFVAVKEEGTLAKSTKLLKERVL